ncbi:MAG TPA: metal-dependent hydrolase [Gammaproteobacteria bacterium]|nr:metal-dependent hydrolase [Gammaproteobacteria bacterium]
MPNAVAHRLVAGLVVCGYSAYAESKKGANTHKPFIHGALASACGTLPDILEPSIGDPNHRQFFHSFTFAGVVGNSMYKIWKWETKDEFDELLKTLGLIAGSAYLIHLIMDSSSPKSLPLI